MPVVFFFLTIIISPIAITFSTISSLFAFLFAPALQRPPIGNCRISFVFSCFFYPSPFYSCVHFFPSCSLASFNHPLLLWKSRLCSSTEGLESLLIIPKHVSHLHKRASKNKPFPCQPPYTLEVKIFLLIFKDAPLSLASPCFPKIISFAFCLGIGPFFCGTV